MKAITVRQPWVSLIASGDKKYETRSWPTKHRGPIAIHAGKQDDPDVFQFFLCKIATMEQLEACGITPKTLQKLPHGAVIATAELVNVWRIVKEPGDDFLASAIVNGTRRITLRAESLSADKHGLAEYFVPTEKEINLGYWHAGMYAWELQNVKLLPEPIPAKGKQGLWDWEPEGGASK